MMNSIVCAAPSTAAKSETLTIKVKLLGDIVEQLSANAWATPKPSLRGPYNWSQGRKLQFIDDVLQEWKGTLRVESDPSFDGPSEITFDGVDQGVYANDDHRPVKAFNGFSWTKPGFHFLKVTDPKSGVSGWSNPVFVTDGAPERRLYWGDPHWQTYFTDGLRCPEELYAFARDEAFLDFGAISDHMEGLTDRQWDYFQLVTNDYNEPGRFATLIGQEWTHHKAGHRNVYVRGDAAPPYRCTDEKNATLEGLWKSLDELAATGEEILAIPHHTSNVIMGCDWSLGWNPNYEKAVEIYSVWGSSENHADDGNPRPLRHCKGEEKGKHVIDALNKGFRFGFVGGGDIHDGRPGAGLSRKQPHTDRSEIWPQGFTAISAPELSREAVFDAIRDRRCHAATRRGVYLEMIPDDGPDGLSLFVRSAAKDGIAKIDVVKNGETIASLNPGGDDGRVLEETVSCGELKDGDYVYARAATGDGDLAWSSPVYGG